MGVYTIHLKGQASDAAVLERAVFVREGFAWGAFVFGPLWMIRHRCWVALLVWFAVQAALVALLVWSPLGRPGFVALQALLALFLGLEGGQIRRGGLLREGYRMVDVSAGDRAAAERRFYAAQSVAEAAVDAPSAAAPFAAPAMVGVFPFSGGPRA